MPKIHIQHIQTIYEYLPTRGCCILQLDPDGPCIHYKKDRNFIIALGLIGEYYGRKYYKNPPLSDYKLGVKYVQKDMSKRNINVTKTQIRKVARPFCRKRHAMKVSNNAYEILQTVRNLIDQESHCFKACNGKKKEYCRKIRQNNIPCVSYLVDDLYHCLIFHGGNLKAGAICAQLLYTLNHDYHLCK